MRLGELEGGRAGEVDKRSPPLRRRHVSHSQAAAGGRYTFVGGSNVDWKRRFQIESMEILQREKFVVWLVSSNSHYDDSRTSIVWGSV